VTAKNEFPYDFVFGATPAAEKNHSCWRSLCADESPQALSSCFAAYIKLLLLKLSLETERTSWNRNEAFNVVDSFNLRSASVLRRIQKVILKIWCIVIVILNQCNLISVLFVYTSHVISTFHATLFVSILKVSFFTLLRSLKVCERSHKKFILRSYHYGKKLRRNANY